MSQYNHLPDNASGIQYSSHNRVNSQSTSFYNQQDATDYDSSNSFPMVQQMTPQQRRQEERRRHAEASTSGSNTTAASAAAAAAGTGASPWLNKQQKKSSKWKTIAWSVLALLLIALAGILAWYFVVHKKNQNNSNNSKTGSGGGHATGTTGKFSTVPPYHPQAPLSYVYQSFQAALGRGRNTKRQG